MLGTKNRIARYRSATRDLNHSSHDWSLRLRSDRSTPRWHPVLMEHAEAVSTRVLHGVHRGVRISEETFDGVAILGKNSDTHTQGQVDFPAADLDGLRSISNDLFAAMFHVLYGSDFGHHDDELVSAHSGHGVRFTYAREQPLPNGREEDIAIRVPKRVVDLFEPVDINEEDGNLMVVGLCSKDRLAETLVEQRAIGEAGQVIMMREIVDMVGAAAVLGNIAAGNGDPVAQPDHLDIEPGTPDHVVVDEHFTCMWNPGADDLAIFLDQAGLNHEGPHFRKNFAVEGFAAYPKAAFGIGIDVLEPEVDNRAGGIRDPFEDVEIVQGAFSSRVELRVVH